VFGVARRGGDAHHLLAHDGVHQGRLADIGLAHAADRQRSVAEPDVLEKFRVGGLQLQQKSNGSSTVFQFAQFYPHADRTKSDQKHTAPDFSFTSIFNISLRNELLSLSVSYELKE